MNIIDRLLTEQPKDDALLQEWQFQISKWILNVMDERGMTQRDVARVAKMTEPQISALIHCDTNATLATLARLSALLDKELLSIATPSQLRYVDTTYSVDSFDTSERTVHDLDLYKESA